MSDLEADMMSEELAAEATPFGPRGPAPVVRERILGLRTYALFALAGAVSR
jgi:hypothetical protein